MARIRTIKPDFMESRSTQALSRDARLFFLQLLTEVDDEGRALLTPKRLAGVLYPGDDEVDSADIDRWLKECESQNMVEIYEIESSFSNATDTHPLGTPERFFRVTHFALHQRISHPTPSKLPPSPSEPASDLDSGDSPDTLRKNSGGLRRNTEGLHEEPGREQGTGNREQGTGNRESNVAPAAATRLSNLFADLIETNGSRRPRVTQAWIAAMERLLRLDERSELEVEAAIRWCQGHEFWHRRVMSPSKLREKFDVLRLDAAAETRKRNGSTAAIIEQMIHESENRNDPSASPDDPGEDERDVAPAPDGPRDS